MARFIECYNKNYKMTMGVNVNKIQLVFIYDKELGPPYIVSSILDGNFEQPPFHKEFNDYNEALKYFDVLMEELNG